MQARIRLREEDAKRKERAHNLRQMLRAHLLMEKDIDYITAHIGTKKALLELKWYEQLFITALNIFFKRKRMGQSDDENRFRIFVTWTAQKTIENQLHV